MTMIDGMAVPFAREPAEIEDLMEKVINRIGEPGSEYAQGVHQTLNWLLGVQNEPPL